MSLRFRRPISHKGAALGHVLLLNINRKEIYWEFKNSITLIDIEWPWKARVKITQISKHYISQWFRSNKLTANVSKSGCMVIGTCQRLHDAPALNTVLNGRGLPDLQQYDYPGLIIRCNLMWDVQINMLWSKLSQKVGFLLRLRHKVPSCMLMTIQRNGTTYPRLLYNSVGLCSLYAHTQNTKQSG